MPALPLADGRFDTVVCTYVLCSVEDQAAALAEIARMLAPGGALLFLEHVRAADGSALGRVQDLIVAPHRWAAAGCRPNRRTEDALATSPVAARVARARQPTQRAADRAGDDHGCGQAVRFGDMTRIAGLFHLQASSSSSGAWSEGFLPLR